MINNYNNNNTLSLSFYIFSVIYPIILFMYTLKDLNKFHEPIQSISKTSTYVCDVSDDDDDVDVDYGCLK